MEVIVPRNNPGVPFMTIRAAANATGLSQYYLRCGCRDGSVPHIKCGNEYRINVPLLIERLNRMSGGTE